MIVYPATHTLRDAGFKFGLAYQGLGPIDQWVIVGQWDSSNIRQNINATIQIDQLRATFGPRRCIELQYGDYRIIAAEDADDVAVLIAEQLDRYDGEYMIDDAAYWNAIAPLVEEVWEGMSPPERIQLILRQQSEPDLLFAEAVPQELFSEVAAMVEAY